MMERIRSIRKSGKSTVKKDDLSDIHTYQTEQEIRNIFYKRGHYFRFNLVTNRAPIAAGMIILANDITNDALNATAALVPTFSKKNTAALSRTPRSPKDIGKMTAFTKKTDDAHMSTLLNETGANAIVKK